MDKGNPENALIQREEVYRGKVVNLVVDTIALPGGRKAIREVVQHPGGVLAVPVLNDGRLLMIRQYRYPLQRHILELPAGKLDSGQSPLETMRRELEEETGYRAANWSYECSFYTSPGFSNEILHLFIARDLTEVAQHLEEGEHITVEPLTVEQCLERLQGGEIVDGKSLLGILLYLRKIVMK
jgi:ADP-ribose pyrophosphatase